MNDGSVRRLWPRRSGGSMLLEASSRVAPLLYLVFIASGALFMPRRRCCTASGSERQVMPSSRCCTARTSHDLPSLPHPLLAGSMIAALPAAGSGTALARFMSATVIVLGLGLAAVHLGHWPGSDVNVSTDPRGSTVSPAVGRGGPEPRPECHADGAAARGMAGQTVPALHRHR